VYSNPVWKFVATEHRTGITGDMVTGDFYGFPFPPCTATPTPLDFLTTYASMSMDMADFDNDGDFDFLVIKTYAPLGGPNEIWILLYTQTGVGGYPSFTQSIVLSITTGLPTNLWRLSHIGLAAADFDNDGRVDFAATIPQTDNPHSNQIRFYRNMGPPTFVLQRTMTATWADYASDMDVGDIDHDSDFDVVIFDYPHGGDGNFRLYWYENVNPATWTFTLHPIINTVGSPILTPHSVGMIVAADFGAPPGPGTARDGWVDFIVGQDDDGDPGQTWLYINNRNSPSRGTYIGPFDAYDLQPSIESGSGQPGSGFADALDCDNDGDFDVVATGTTASGNPLAYTLYYVYGNGAGGFNAPVATSTTAGPAVTAPPIWYYPFGKAEAPVGGIFVSVDKFGLLAPYVGLASTILVATAAATIYVKRVKHKREKQ